MTSATGTCNPADGVCFPDPVADSTPCQDGDFCTSETGVEGGADHCFGGVCTGIPVDCSAFDDSCNDGVCDPSTGACFADPKAESTPCEDGDVCTSETGTPGTPDHCDGLGSCVGVPVAATLTIKKFVNDDDGGVLDPDDFEICLEAADRDGNFFECFWGDAAGTEFVLYPSASGALFTVSEDLAWLADDYNVSFSGSCSGTLACGTDAICEVTNDDIDNGQRSIAVNDVDACQDVNSIHGSWVVTDESNSGNIMDGVIVLVDDFETDFDWKAGRRDPYEASDFDANTFNAEGSTTEYTCMYMVTSDLDPDNQIDCEETRDDTTGEITDDCPPVEFDEDLTVEYWCTLDPGVPSSGVIRVHGTIEAQSRGPNGPSPHSYSSAQDWPLSGRPNQRLPVCIP
jgi:hypothetical protein